jgi:ribulose bisphosphate carboxylase small subunit
MDREDIIRMAREAGFKVDWQHADVAEIKAKRYEYFAALVAAHEREACAKVCDVLAVHPEYASDITKVAAQAIRARGNT